MGSRRWAALVAAVSLLVLHGAARGASHTFDGNCEITGIVSWTSYGVDAYTFAGTGACTGMLDGEMVRSVPVNVETEGEVNAFLVPVLGNGDGTFVFTDQKLKLPIAVQQLGPAIRVFAACKGCSGGWLGALQTFSEAQPEPGPHGPRAAIRIVTQSVQTVTW